MNAEIKKNTKTFNDKFSAFICDSPLYAPLELSNDPKEKDEEIEHIRRNSFKIDMHCIYCKKEATFIRFTDSDLEHHQYLAKSSSILMKNEISFTLVCLRVSQHIYKFSLLQTNEDVIKIGQYPSMESISNGDISKYKSVLKNQDFSELHRAGGLASHGIGIGSYVYLRRIFERLIYQHYENYKSNKGEIDNFSTLRIDDKISTLSAELPTSLVQNKIVYKILSKGIHELDEDTCKKYYPIVKAVIIAILEEDLQRNEKLKAERQLNSALSSIMSELTSSEDDL